MTRTVPPLVLSLMLTASLLAGCSKPRPVHLHSTQIEIYDPTDKKHYVVKEVQQGELAEIQATLTWPDPGNAGTHKFRWDVYKGTERIRTGITTPHFFRSSPTIVLLEIDSTALGVGEFRCVLFLDEVETTTVMLKIVSRMR